MLWTVQDLMARKKNGLRLLLKRIAYMWDSEPICTSFCRKRAFISLSYFIELLTSFVCLNGEGSIAKSHHAVLERQAATSEQVYIDTKRATLAAVS
jgi:hypothetical protein